jgi:hypothetical protein
MAIMGWSQKQITRYTVLKAYAFKAYRYAYSDQCVSKYYNKIPALNRHSIKRVYVEDNEASEDALVSLFEEFDFFEEYAMMVALVGLWLGW